MTGLVYIIDRDGELDVYASLLDAEEALEILGVGYSIVEQAVFAETTGQYGDPTREFLEELRRDRGDQ